MKKTMGYLLIVAGVLAIVGGLLLITRQNAQKEQVIILSNSSARHSSDSITSRQATTAPSQSPSASPQAPAAPAASRQTDNTPTPHTPESAKSEPTPHEKGERFEDFVANIFADWRLKLLERTQDKVSSAGVVAESCKNPDFHVEQKYGKSQIDYYIECKYRSKWNNGCIAFEEYQIKRYKDFQRKKRRKVLIALGVGGTPDRPEILMLVPLDSIKDNTIRKIDTRYAVSPNSDTWVKYMENYFSSVFQKSRARQTDN